VTHTLVHQVKMSAIERKDMMDPFNAKETNAKIQALKPMLTEQEEIIGKQIEQLQKSRSGLNILKAELTAEQQNLAAANVGKKMLEMMTVHYCEAKNLKKVDYSKDGDAILDHMAQLLKVKVRFYLTLIFVLTGLLTLFNCLLYL